MGKPVAIANSGQESLMEIDAIKKEMQRLQWEIVSQLAEFDGRSFRREQWHKDPDGKMAGGGLTCVIENGNFFEKGGVNFSDVSGKALPAAATARRPQLAGRRWQAMGISTVLHPRNPYCPTSHMNIRCFIAHPANAGESPVWWFGGGMDLTPYYGFEEDARDFHEICRQSLSPWGDEVYQRYKRWCDDYFFLPHRNEARGIGGIFFDDLDSCGPDREDCSANWDWSECWRLTQRVGEHFLLAYLPICKRRKNISWAEHERDFQAYRRGRYVEFNLVCDRGTQFGLQSGGRAESILMSLPPLASWRYDWHPAHGSPEARLAGDFLRSRDWLAR